MFEMQAHKAKMKGPGGCSVVVVTSKVKELITTCG